MSITSEDLRKALRLNAKEDALSGPLLEKCAAHCARLNITASGFADQVEAFLTNNHEHKITVDIFGKFEQVLNKPTYKPMKQVDSFRPAPAIKKEVSTPNTPSQSSQKSAYPSSPESVSGYMSDPGTPGSATNLYNTRKNQGQSVLSFNQNLGGRGEFNPSDRKPIPSRCTIAMGDQDFANLKDRYQYMYTPMNDRAHAINKNIQALGTAIAEGSFISEIHPVGVASPDLVWVYGRICNDSSEGKLNKHSIVLEGSLEESGGKRVQLDVNELPDYSLFPGQVVMVQGINSSGKVMVAKRIIEGQRLPLPRTSPSSLLEMSYSKRYQGGTPITVRVAAGPYTTSDNLNFEPFMDLLSSVLTDKPDVVILLGPFVDCNHPLLQGGDVHIASLDDDDSEELTLAKKKQKIHPAVYETLFKERFLKEGFGRFFNTESSDGDLMSGQGSAERIATQFILVPSVNDLFHENVFPQPPFGDRVKVKTRFFDEPLGELKIPGGDDELKRVFVASNPCMFRINETLFGTTSNDMLFSLLSDEASKTTDNKLTRLASHILQQRSFYPQFPSPIQVPLDFRYSKHWTMSKYAPDVLLLPSKLTSLVKDIDGTLVINPGQLAKGTAGGTYADITIHPLSADTLREAEKTAKANAEEGSSNETLNLPHNIASRTFVNIVKI